jgi:regulator of protease activity HflC (stomatin/prohibitin superfamily)
MPPRWNKNKSPNSRLSKPNWWWSQADAAVIAAKGQADARILQAEAEAKALKVIAEALKQNQELLTYQYINKLAPGVQVMLVPNNAPFMLPLPTPPASIK